MEIKERDEDDRGEKIEKRKRVVEERREGKGWKIKMEDKGKGRSEKVKERIMVNEEGKWEEKVMKSVEGERKLKNISMVKGRNIVVRRKF